MAKQLQIRRGHHTDIESNAGAIGELFIDEDEWRLVIGDGATLGGHPVAKFDEIFGVFGVTTLDTSTTIVDPGVYPVITPGITLTLDVCPGLVMIKDLTGASRPNIHISATIDGDPDGFTISIPRESVSLVWCQSEATWLIV